MSRIWDAESEIMDISSRVRAARESLDAMTAERQADREAASPTDLDFGLGSMSADLTADTTDSIHVFCWHAEPAR